MNSLSSESVSQTIGASSPTAHELDGISVIIPTYNGVEWVCGALNSVLSQESPVPIEVVVVDDCSTDGTVRVIQELNDPRISCYSTGKNSGVAAARNLGIKRAKYGWIAFNDQDDVWCAGRLLKQIKVLKELPGVIGVAGGAARLSSDGVSAWTGKFFGFRWTPTLRLNLSAPPYYNPVNDGISYLQTLVIAKQIALDANGFLENLPLADDFDFALKVGGLGKFGYVDEPVFLYRLGNHNQTAPSVAKAHTFLAAHAFVQAAHVARSAGASVPDAAVFMSQYEPTVQQVAEFRMRQSIRHINTIWVYQGLMKAMFAGVGVLLSNPKLFIRYLIDRIKFWTRKSS